MRQNPNKPVSPLSLWEILPAGGALALGLLLSLLDKSPLPFAGCAALGILILFCGRRRTKEILQATLTTDPLTELYNRRGFEIFAAEHLKRAKRKKTALLVILADISGLDLVNQRHGQPEGDAALTGAAQVLRGAFRDSDVIARIGEDEFAALAVDAFAESGALLLNRLQEKLKAYNAQKSHPYDLALRLSAFEADPDQITTPEALLAEADRLLHFKKENHLNR